MNLDKIRNFKGGTMETHKYSLRQKVKLVGEKWKHFEGAVGTIIALNIQSPEAYASDYCVVIAEDYDRQYPKPKLQKKHVQEAEIAAIEVITLYAYKDSNNEIHFMSDELNHMEVHSRIWTRFKKADFEKVL